MLGWTNHIIMAAPRRKSTCHDDVTVSVSGVRMMTRQLNMTFEMGRDATLTCSVRNIGKKRVSGRLIGAS